ncbi:MAG TPA: hypothetical protein VLM75_01790 [Spirochaetota bacterium]|nr:hypothetical protein [Spirochaetota bacterium]
MERVEIWYITDSKAGEALSQSIRYLGLSMNLVTDDSFAKAEILSGNLNIFIVDLSGRDLPGIMSVVRDDRRLQGFLKFVILKKGLVKEALSLSANMLQVEFISRPVDKREFILLLEKSILVERYREMMHSVSRDVEDRIETFESLMSINRKDFFVTDKERDAFQRIIEHEKHLVSEQARLNRAIREFTSLRQMEIFNMTDRIKAEEMLADLRRRELMDANSVIRAQESLIDFSSRELHQANRIINAAETVVELGRQEAISLREELADAQKLNSELTEEVGRLEEELKSLKGKGHR